MKALFLLSMIFVFLCSSVCFSNNISEALDGNGKIRSNISGSFSSTDGFKMSTGKSGEPVFHNENIEASNFLLMGSGVNATVFAIAVSGTDVYVGGNFTIAGGVPANYIAKWNGSVWSALGDGMNQYVASIVISGTDVYAGGAFEFADGNLVHHIAKWNGTSWSALGEGIDNTVKSLALSGTDLYAGGFFSTAGTDPANHIAKWNGTSWSALGSGTDQEIYSVAVSGSNVYAVGYFTIAGGVPANHIAKWNGSAWSALGSGLDDFTDAIIVSGTDVYAGGYFLNAGGIPASYIAKWNGTSWSAVNGGTDGPVNYFALSGSDLIVGGQFSSVNGNSANNIARLSGSAWSSFSSGLNNNCYAIAVTGTDIYIGGNFTDAGGLAVNHITKWGEVPAPGDLIISEFRFSGPGGANDEFIEFYNTKDSPLIVSTTDGSAGWSLLGTNGIVRFTIPNGTVIQPRGHFLAINSGGYTLSSYPAGNSTFATGDITYTGDIPAAGGGVALFVSDHIFNVPSRMDAAGYSDANFLYREGTGITAQGLNQQHSYFRDEASGRPKDTDDNSLDFKYVNCQSIFNNENGTAGPENSSSPVIGTTGGLIVTVADPSQTANSSPNFERSYVQDFPTYSSYGTIKLRFKIKNTTGQAISRLRFRGVDITSISGVSGNASLNLRTSPDESITITGSGTVTCRGTSLEAIPYISFGGGGNNSSISVSSITPINPLQNNDSIYVQILLGIFRRGNIRAFFNLESFPPANAGTFGTGSGPVTPFGFFGTEYKPQWGSKPPSFNLGDIIISEFRFRGPSGVKDEYVELYNKSDSLKVVNSSDGSPGWAVVSGDGVTQCVIPNGTVIPSKAHFLIAGNDFSLKQYPSENGYETIMDIIYYTDIPDNSGVALFTSTTAFNLSNRMCAAGFATAPSLYREGAGIPPIVLSSTNYCFYRKETIGGPRNTGDNVTDFKFSDALGNNLGFGQSIGFPGPQSSSSPVNKGGGIIISFADPQQLISAPPNFVRDLTPDPSHNSSFGALDFRLKIKNQTGSKITSLRFRLTDLTTFPSPALIADLRARKCSDVSISVNGSPITCKGTDLDLESAQPVGGGINSSLAISTINFANPLENNDSIYFRLLFGSQQNGNINIAFIAEALSEGSAGASGTGVGSSVPFVINGTDTTPLPVELESFTSTLSGKNNVMLKWRTANEVNNKGFDIERKVSGSTDWVKKGSVDGHNTTNEAHDYSYTDNNVSSGSYNYRLKQIDFNGNYKYYDLSNEVIVGVPMKYNIYQNYPNPFNPVTNIKYDIPFDSRVSIKIFDITGREVSGLVDRLQQAGYYTVNFNASALASGVYFYQINAQGKNQNYVKAMKMVLIK